MRRFEEMKELLDGGSGGFYGEILEPYLSDTQGKLRDLQQSLEQGDTRSIRAIAHTLKGSSLNLGFVGLGNRARQVEAEAKEGTIGDPRSLAAALQDEFRRISLFAELHRSGAGGLDGCAAGAGVSPPSAPLPAGRG
jgi:HPt (histidine-containing phosphotransfer) domain-containing protein